MNGHLEVVELLLQSDADVNVKNNVSTENHLTSTIHSLLRKLIILFVIEISI